MRLIKEAVTGITMSGRKLVPAGCFGEPVPGTIISLCILQRAFYSELDTIMDSTFERMAPVSVSDTPENHIFCG
jgi:hypothetical protein